MTRGLRDACPACGEIEVRTLFPATDRLYATTEKTFLIVECRKCRLIRLFPQPSPLELHDYYPRDYWFVPDATAADRLEQWYRRLVLRDHLHFVERALRESEERGLVVDVGCGGGRTRCGRYGALPRDRRQAAHDGCDRRR